jgi:hypothetical protein
MAIQAEDKGPGPHVTHLLVGLSKEALESDVGEEVV